MLPGLEESPRLVQAPGRPDLVEALRDLEAGESGDLSAAIAQTELEYVEMWAQDVAAMAGYHGQVSAAAAQLTSWQASWQAFEIDDFVLATAYVGPDYVIP